ncbi:hypothetical protein [Streptomyces sp. bgisy091]|uniref:hypothetical protein n=1 Tax=Streptomyces sp. bgisy091 TaxID=3413778 RepID=UPI003D70D720
MSEDALLVREAMERTAEELAPLPDLVPGAVSRGMRRRAAVRLGLTAGVFGTLTVAALGASALSGGDSGASTAATGTGVAAEPYRTPVHVVPTPGQTEDGGFAGLPAEERRRLEDFQQRAAVALDDALPDSVGTIRPVDSSVALYQGEKDGSRFLVTFEVRPGDGERAEDCRDVPAKGMTCEKARLTDAVEARLRRAATGSMDTTSAAIGFRFGNSEVLINVSPDEEKGISAPLTTQRLLEGVRESGLLEVVRYADEHPVLGKQVSVRGG